MYTEADAAGAASLSDEAAGRRVYRYQAGFVDSGRARSRPSRCLRPTRAAVKKKAVQEEEAVRSRRRGDGGSGGSGGGGEAGGDQAGQARQAEEGEAREDSVWPGSGAGPAAGTDDGLDGNGQGRGLGAGGGQWSDAGPGNDDGQQPVVVGEDTNAADPMAMAAKPAPAQKTRYAARAQFVKAKKIKAKKAKAADKVAATPTAMTAEEKATQKVQAAPLGLNGDMAKKKTKKKRAKGQAKERLAENKGTRRHTRRSPTARMRRRITRRTRKKGDPSGAECSAWTTTRIRRRLLRNSPSSAVRLHWNARLRPSRFAVYVAGGGVCWRL